MRRTTTVLSIALMLTGFLAAPAQNNIPMPERLNRPNANFEQSAFGKPKASASEKTKSGSDWWEPDTVCIFSRYSMQDSMQENRRIFLLGVASRCVEVKAKLRLCKTK